jgi:ketosteroid isomerase-like protein
MHIAVLLACSMAAEVDPLVQAERAFAATVKDKGLKAGFLSVMDDESVLFRPGPVPGRKNTEGSADTVAVLEWEPAFAAMTKSGNYGFTTGPWQVRPKPKSEPVAFGHYLSIWRKTDKGWRLILDCGTATEEAPVQPYTVKPLEFGAAIKEADLEAVAKTFAEDRTKLAATHCDASAVSFWTGELPAIGPMAIGMRGDSWPMSEVKVLKAQAWEEMGVVYGTFKSKAGPGHFVQVWRNQDSGPKLLCELEMVDPKQG